MEAVETLRFAYESIASQGGARTINAVGSPADSRRVLARLADIVAGGRVLRGRWLPYPGGSMTALGEVVREACGIVDADDRPTVLRRIEGALGEPDPTATSRLLDVVGSAERGEPLWGAIPATRTLLEKIADASPVVVILEGAEHADPQFAASCIGLAPLRPRSGVLLIVASPVPLQGWDDVLRVTPADAPDGVAVARDPGELLLAQGRSARAEDHLEYGRALRDRLGERASERAEAIGTHLAQGGDRADAVKWFQLAATRAIERADMPSALELFDRAAALLQPSDPALPEVLTGLAEALLSLKEPQGAEEVAGDALRFLGRSAEGAVAARARVIQMSARVQLGHDVALADLAEVASQLRELGDGTGLAEAAQTEAAVHWVRSDYDRAIAAIERGLAVEGAASYQHENLATWRASALLAGPEPVREAITRCHELMSDGRRNEIVTARCLVTLGGLLAFADDFDEARSALDRAVRLQEEVGQPPAIAGTPTVAADVEYLAGEPQQAVDIAHSALGAADQLGPDHVVILSAIEARAAFAAGNGDAVEQALARCRAATPPGDASVEALYAGIEARVSARAGDVGSAEETCRSVAETFAADFQPRSRADALVDLADVLELAGRTEDARDALEEALRLYEAKGIRPLLRAVREALLRLGSAG